MSAVTLVLWPGARKQACETRICLFTYTVFLLSCVYQFLLSFVFSLLLFFFSLFFSFLFFFFFFFLLQISDIRLILQLSYKNMYQLVAPIEFFVKETKKQNETKITKINDVSISIIIMLSVCLSVRLLT